MAKIKRSPSEQAAFNEVRHQAAIKCWQKRKRKGEQAAAGGAGIAQAAAGAVEAHRVGVGVGDAGARVAVDDRAGGVIKITGHRGGPPEAVPLEGQGGAQDWRMRGPYQSRGDFGSNQQYDQLERDIRESPQREAKYNCGKGISEAYKVYLETGQKGNFKPSRGEVYRGEDGRPVRAGIKGGQQAERELGAWEVAKLVGMDDMVAPVQIRNCDVPGGENARKSFPAAKQIKGSFAVWQEGDVAKEIYDDKTKFDGDEDQRRTALFDYIIGNQDRHHGNWVIGGDGKMKLIDHGLAFGETKLGGFKNRQIQQRVAYDHSKHDAFPPSKYAESYLKSKLKIRAKLLKIGLPALAVERVMARIDRAATATNWRDLYGDTE